MARWRARTLLIALALLAIGVGIYLCLPKSPRFTEDQYERIQLGMTLAEVEAVLGCPPGNYAPVDLVSMARGKQPRTDWAADVPEPLFNDQQRALCIHVLFDADGKVKEKHCTRMTYFPPTLLERLRAWVGW